MLLIGKFGNLRFGASDKDNEDSLNEFKQDAIKQFYFRLNLPQKRV